MKLCGRAYFNDKEDWEQLARELGGIQGKSVKKGQKRNSQVSEASEKLSWWELNTPKKFF